MEIYHFRPLPSTFRLKNLAEITARALGPAKRNPHGEEVYETMRDWFLSFQGYDPSKASALLQQFSSKVATYDFPDADIQHLKTCVAAIYWGFAVDDVADEGDLHAQPDKIKSISDKYLQALSREDFSSPEPYAMMLHDIFKRIKMTATAGNCQRFVSGLQEYFSSEVVQSRHRSEKMMASVSDFIQLRRSTIAGPFVWATVEYSLDINLPDYVFEDPVYVEIDKAAKDIMAWQNDLCSFNKEQAENDYQNLVCCIMMDQMIELQDAVDFVTDMLESRVNEYINLKASLPSFKGEVDSELARYLTGIGNIIQGGIAWSYLTSRYFSSANQDGLEKKGMHIELKRMDTPFD